MLEPPDDPARRAAAEAHVLLEAGQFRAAEEAARRALSQDPAAPTAWLVLARSLVELGRASEAADAATRAIALAPDRAEPLVALGDVHLLGTNRYGEAIAAYSRAAHLDPLSIDAFTGRAQATLRCVPSPSPLPRERRRREELISSAQRDAEYALTLGPEEALPHVVLGKVLLARGRPSEAIAATDRALRIDPTHYVALQVRGLAQRELGDIEGASESIVAAARQNPRSSTSMSLLRNLRVIGPIAFVGIWIAFHVVVGAVDAAPVSEGVAVTIALGLLVFLLFFAEPLARRRQRRSMTPAAQQALRLDAAQRRAHRTRWLRQVRPRNRN